MDEGGMQLMDDCSDLFIKVPELTDIRKTWNNVSSWYTEMKMKNHQLPYWLTWYCQLLITQWLLSVLFHITTFSETTSGCQRLCKV